MSMLQVILLTICAVAQVTMQAYVMPPADANLHVYALPVGQGDATVIQCPAGTGGLTIVDFGSSVRQQPTLGITYMTDADINTFFGPVYTVDYVYLTHGDRDHYNLLSKLNIPSNTVKGVAIGCQEGNYGTLTSWLQQVATYGNLKKFPDSTAGGCTTSCSSRIQICTGGVYMNVMGANLDIYSGKDCTNTDSLVTRLEYNNFRLLLPGDAEDYSGFRYDSNGYITSNVGGWLGKPGLLRTLINDWAPYGGIQANFYRLAHHGTYPNGNKEFFLNAVAIRYGFSSSMLPGTPGTFNHPKCDLYDLLVTLPTIATVTGGMQQTEYSCGDAGDRYLEDNNTKGVYTTAVCSAANIFNNYIIKIDTDGNINNWIGPIQLAPSAMTCT